MFSISEKQGKAFFTFCFIVVMAGFLYFVVATAQSRNINTDSHIQVAEKYLNGEAIPGVEAWWIHIPHTELSSMAKTIARELNLDSDYVFQQLQSTAFVVQRKTVK